MQTKHAFHETNNFIGSRDKIRHRQAFVYQRSRESQKHVMTLGSKGPKHSGGWEELLSGNFCLGFLWVFNV